MTTIAELSVLVGANIAGLQTGLQQANRLVEDTTRSFASRLQGIGTTLTGVGAQMSLVTAPLMNFGLSGIQVASDFDSAMSEISARTGLVGPALDAIADKALQLGADTAFSGQQAAEAFLQILTSGSSVEEAFALIGPVLDGAAASGEDLGHTADVVTDILAAFGLGAESGADVVEALAQAAGASSADIGALGEGFANVGGKASAFGLSVQDTAAILALFSENGIKGAEAGTQLRSMLTNMTRDTDDVQAAWDALNTSMYDSQGAMRPLDDVIADIGRGLEGMTDEQKNKIINDLAGSYGELGLRAMLGSISMDDMIARMEETAGAAEVARARLDNLNGDVDALGGSVERLQYRAFMPLIDETLRPLAQLATTIVNKIGDWVEANPDLTRIIIEFGAALAMAGPAALALGVGIMAFTSPIFLGVAGMLALGVAIKNLLPAFRQFIGAVGEILSGFDLGGFFGGIANAVSGIDLSAITDPIKTAIDNCDLTGKAQVVRDKIAGLLRDAGALLTDVKMPDISTSVQDAFTRAITEAKAIDTSAIQTWATENFDTVARSLVSVASIVFGGPFGATLGIASLVNTAISNNFLGLGDLVNTLRPGIEAAFGEVKRIIDDVINAIFGGGGGGEYNLPGMSIAEDVANAVGNPGQSALLKRVTDDISKGIQTILDIASTIGEGVITGLRNFGDGVASFAQSILSINPDDFYTFIRPFAAVFGGFVTAAAAVVGKGIEVALTLLGAALAFLGDGVNRLVTSGAALMNGDVGRAISTLGVPGVVVGIAATVVGISALTSAFTAIAGVVTWGLAAVLGAVGAGISAVGAAVALATSPVTLLVGALALLALAATTLLPGIVQSWNEAFTQIGNFVQNVLNKVNDLIEKFSGLKLSVGPVDLSNANNGVFEPSTWQPGGPAIGVNGSHAAGLASVPWDGYIAQLHRGERVLTAAESRDYGGGARVVVNMPITAYGETPDALARMVKRKFKELGIGEGAFD